MLWNKISPVLILSLLLTTGCAVPFHSAETLPRGKQKFSTGYSLINNYSIRYDVGFTGVTDFGLGVDLALPCFSPLFFCEAKQHLFPISPRKEGVKLLAVGSYGITILPNQRHTSKYYLYGVLLGLRTDENTLYTLGVGNLKDPRYFYNYINSEVNTSVHYTIHGGIEFKKHIFQVQYIHRKDPSHSGIINFGIGFK